MTMTAAARMPAIVREDPEDVILAAIRHARLRPPMPERERTLLVALDAEATGERRTWQSLMDEVAALAPAE